MAQGKFVLFWWIFLVNFNCISLSICSDYVHGCLIIQYFLKYFSLFLLFLFYVTCFVFYHLLSQLSFNSKFSSRFLYVCEVKTVLRTHMSLSLSVHTHIRILLQLCNFSMYQSSCKCHLSNRAQLWSPSKGHVLLRKLW